MSNTNKILQKLDAVSNKVETLDNKVNDATKTKNLGIIDRAPFARRGESIMSSRGFRFGKLIGALGTNACINDEDAKIELEYCSRFTKKMENAGYRRDKVGNSVLVPLAPEFFPEDLMSKDEYHEMKSLLGEGISGYDPQDSTQWMKTKAAASPAQSWVDSSIGGSFVPPPSFGPPIELLRNQEVFMSAGCTTVPLGPSGRIVFPRLTGATTGAFSPENTQATATQAQTGQLELSAKKVISFVVLPGELLRFGSPATEQIIRNDMMKTVSLQLDKQLLEGPGSSNLPLGLATMGSNGNYGVQIVTPTNANQLAPEDVYQFLALIEEQNMNASECAWIMRPKMKWCFQQARFTPYSGGTSLGTFVFDLTRSLADGGHDKLAGLPVISSVQVSNTRGSGAQTYVICFPPKDYYLGLWGALEITQSDAGYVFLSSDQVGVRALLFGDGGPRHPGAVAFCDSLNFTVAG